MQEIFDLCSYLGGKYLCNQGCVGGYSEWVEQGWICGGCTWSYTNGYVRLKNGDRKKTLTVTGKHPK